MSRRFFTPCLLLAICLPTLMTAQSENGLVPWGPELSLEWKENVFLTHWLADGSYLVRRLKDDRTTIEHYTGTHELIGISPGKVPDKDMVGGFNLPQRDTTWFGQYVWDKRRERTRFFAGPVTPDGLETSVKITFPGMFLSPNPYSKVELYDDKPWVKSSEEHQRFFYANARAYIDKGAGEEVDVAVFDRQFNTVWERTIELPFEDDELFVHQADGLLDSNTIVLTARTDPGVTKEGPSQYIFLVDDQHVRSTEVKLPPEAHFISHQVKIEAGDQESIVIYGVYSITKKRRTVDGIIRIAFNRDLEETNRSDYNFSGTETYQPINHFASRLHQAREGLHHMSVIELPNGHTWAMIELCASIPSTSDYQGYYRKKSLFVFRYDAAGEFTEAIEVEKDFDALPDRIGYDTRIIDDRVYLLFNTDEPYSKWTGDQGARYSATTKIVTYTLDGEEVSSTFLNPNEPRNGDRPRLPYSQQKGSKLLLQTYVKDGARFGTLDLGTLSKR